jgi:hypothetical protein
MILKCLEQYVLMEFKMERIGSWLPLESACEEYYRGRWKLFLAMDKELILEKIRDFLYYSVVA